MAITNTELVHVYSSYFSCSAAVLPASRKATEKPFLQSWQNQREQQFAVPKPHGKKGEIDHLLLEQLFFDQLHLLQSLFRAFERSVDWLVLHG